MRAERIRLGNCVDCGNPVGSLHKWYCDYHRLRAIERHKETLYRRKSEVFQAYGGVKCACCGEERMPFLTLDHIDGKGADHRRELFGNRRNGAGEVMYRWLRKQGFPAGFQVLCWNCNWAKHSLGECPHQTERRGHD